MIPYRYGDAHTHMEILRVWVLTYISQLTSEYMLYKYTHLQSRWVYIYHNQIKLNLSYYPTSEDS